MTLLAELKRRNVLRMAGLYLVGAWLVTQVAGTVLPMFGAPGWLPRSVVILLAIGFVPALVFAWVFEMTPGGLKRDDELQPSASIAPQTAKRLDRIIIVVLVLALGYFAVDKFVLTPKRDAVSASPETARGKVPTAAMPAQQQASIAVLPFVNMSADAENGFFADGISEELLNVLARVDGLKVASRTSAFSFKGKDTAIPEIARQLGVAHVLEGSVRKQGDRVRITAQLIHAGTDGHLWSETYDRDLTDIFKVQEEIAVAITRELEGLLGKREVKVAASTGNLDAYQRFLSGRARFHQRKDLLGAANDLEAAVKQDPNFAEAWVYLAAAWLTAPGYYDEKSLKVADARRNAKAALERAEALLPRHPMVLAVKANMLEDAGDPVGALSLFEQVLPGQQDSTPTLWRAQLLLRAGYVQQAISGLETARKIDPLVGVTNGYLAIAYLSAGQQDKAQASAQTAAVQGWMIALNVVANDLKARGQRRQAVALVDAVRSQVAPSELQRLDTLKVELQDNGPSEYAHLLDDAERDLKLAPRDRPSQHWLMGAWMPSFRGLRQDHRFFEVARSLGLVRLWDSRGYPDGCRRVQAPTGDHLECRELLP